MNRRAYAQNLAYLAGRLVACVHDESPEDIRSALTALRAALSPPGVRVDDAIAITLAAMVDPSATTRQLESWITRLDGHLGDLYPGRNPVCPVNKLAVEMGVRGTLPAASLNAAERVEVVHRLRKHLSTEQIAAHLDAEPHEVRQWASTPSTDDLTRVTAAAA